MYVYEKLKRTSGCIPAAIHASNTRKER